MKSKNQREIIYERINSSSRILLSLHLDADPDSIGSNLAMKSVLEVMGKKVIVITPDKLSNLPSFLPQISAIENKDIKEIDSSDIDLYIALDSADPKMITHHETFVFPKEKIVNIDHHKTNSFFGANNLIEEASSCCELLYKLFKGWQVTIDKDCATSLLFGVMGDTGTFKYPSLVTFETFDCTSDLLKNGANYEEICKFLHQNTPHETLKFWGLALDRSQVIRIGKYSVFVSSVPFEEIQKVVKPEFVFGAASEFFQTVKDTDFGLLLTEEQKGILGGSLRARTEVDVSLIAKSLGGGGHKTASGFTVKMLENESFEDACRKVLLKVGEVLDAENKN